MKKPVVFTSTLLVVAFATLASSQNLIQAEMTAHDLFGMEPRNVREGIHIRAVGLPTLRLSRVEIDAGHSTPNHNHPDEEMVLLIEGSIRARSGDQEFLLQPGEMISIPAYVEHHYEALEDSVTIEAFGPGRNWGAMGMGGG